jgi:putative flippase GtrA
MFMRTAGFPTKTSFIVSHTPKTDVAVQLARYAIVSAPALSVDIGSLFTLTQYFHVNYLASAAVGFCAGVIVNYILCTHWVFQRGKLQNKTLEFLIFLSIGLIGLITNQSLMWCLTDCLHLHYLISKANSIAIVFFWNFFARKIILFR